MSAAEAHAGPATRGAGAVLLTLAAGQFLMTVDSAVLNVAIATVAAWCGSGCWPCSPRWSCCSRPSALTDADLQAALDAAGASPSVARARSRSIASRESRAFRTPSPFWHSSRWLLRRGP
jgi:hypothetical protein